MAKAHKATTVSATEGRGGSGPAPVDDRLSLDLRPSQIDKARSHLVSRLRRLVLEGIHSAFDPGAVYRTIRDIQALDLINATAPETKEAPAVVQTVEEAAEAQRQAQEAHKAEEARKAARGE